MRIVNYDIDRVIEGKQDYEVLEWFASLAEVGESLTPVEEVPAQVFQIDYAWRNGFVDLLWSDLVHLAYDGLPALDHCGYQSAIDATRELQSLINRYNFSGLLKESEELIPSLEGDVRDALLEEAAKLEQKHSIISREFNRRTARGWIRVCSAQLARLSPTANWLTKTVGYAPAAKY